MKTTLGSADEDVIRFFDGQAIRGAAIRELVDATADFACGIAGIRMPNGTTYSAGSAEPKTPGVRVSLPQGGECWITSTDPRCWLIARRLAVTVQLLSNSTEVSVSPLHTLLREGGNTPAGARALTALDCASDTLAFAVWLQGESQDRQAVLDHLERSGQPLLARTDNSSTTVALVQANADELQYATVPLEIRSAFSGPRPVSDANLLWSEVAVAARFSLPATRSNGPFGVLDGVFFNANTGAFALLASADMNAVAKNSDVIAISKIAAEEGTEVLRILEAYSSTRSMRKASELLFVHYNTVAYWVRKAEQVLGYTTADPYRQAQLFLALCFYRLSTTGAFHATIP